MRGPMGKNRPVVDLWVRGGNEASIRVACHVLVSLHLFSSLILPARIRFLLSPRYQHLSLSPFPPPNFFLFHRQAHRLPDFGHPHSFLQIIYLITHTLFNIILILFQKLFLCTKQTFSPNQNASLNWSCCFVRWCCHGLCCPRVELLRN